MNAMVVVIAILLKDKLVFETELNNILKSNQMLLCKD